MSEVSELMMSMSSEDLLEFVLTRPLDELDGIITEIEKVLSIANDFAPPSEFAIVKAALTRLKAARAEAIARS